MFKFSFAFLAGTMAAASVAVAADLPYRAAPPPVVPLPIFTWTGFYVGANAGAAFDSTDRQNNFDLPLNSVTGSLGTNGTLHINNNKKDDVLFTGGGQIGYNYQFTPGRGLVVGFEADAQYIGLGDRNGAGTDYTFTPRLQNGVPALGVAFAPPTATLQRNTVRNLDYFGTVRARVGYGFNRFLAYATGGFAYTGENDWDFGYAAGGGLEYAMTNNISVKVEGLYVNLDDRISNPGAASYNVNTNVLTLTDRRQQHEFEVGRVGINYRF